MKRNTARGASKQWHPGFAAHDFPLEAKWTRVRSRLASTPPPDPMDVTRNKYLEVSERIVRDLAKFQQPEGSIIEPYAPYKEGFSTARWAGGLAQLIQAGRCHDLHDNAVRALDWCMQRLHRHDLSPEFWVPELMHGWNALADSVTARVKKRWRRIWQDHDPQSSYGTLRKDRHFNLTSFVILGEFRKAKAGLQDNLDLVDNLLTDQIERNLFTSHGLYMDPHQPMTYALVVAQNWNQILHFGYDGRPREAVHEIVRRAALTHLFMQSPTGQAPFGGRSNQFNFVEGHMACLFESMARAYDKLGDNVGAGAFKRAARLALKCVQPWIIDMSPARHLKHGYHPSAGHGTDSGGTYTVYAALTASLFATAYHLSNENIEERLCPAELGGYAFDLGPEFHKVFATCAGYHVQVETRADPTPGHRKESTGLGRIHRLDIRGETALSASIAAHPDYSIGKNIMAPETNLAFGPAWKTSRGHYVRLADFSEKIASTDFSVDRETEDCVVFSVRYTGDFGEPRKIREHYRLSIDGVKYRVEFDPPNINAVILIPLLITDGEHESTISIKDGRITLKYRDAVYQIDTGQGSTPLVLDVPLLCNKNGMYATARVQGNSIENITLNKQVTHKKEVVA